MKKRSATFGFGRFTVEVKGWEFPEAKEFFDTNWLVVKARCISETGETVTNGPFIRTTEIRSLCSSLEHLLQGKTHSAKLDGLEPYIYFKVARDADSEMFLAEVELWPDEEIEGVIHHLRATKRELIRCLDNCQTILTQYPVRYEGS